MCGYYLKYLFEPEVGLTIVLKDVCVIVKPFYCPKIGVKDFSKKDTKLVNTGYILKETKVNIRKSCSG